MGSFQSKWALALALVFTTMFVLPHGTAFADDEEEATEEASSNDESSDSDNGSKRKLTKTEDEDDSSSKEETASEDSSSGDEEVASNDGESEEKNARAEELFKRTKALVKRFDAFDGKKFPVPVIESAVRREFLRQAEGKRDIGWMKGKKLNAADLAVAQDNFALFLSYAEKLAGNAGNKKAQADKDANLNIVKAMIEKYSTPKGMAQLPTLESTPDGLSGTGRKEIKRRSALLGNLIPTDGYHVLTAKKIDDVGKAYRARLVSASKEFENLAKTLGGTGKMPKADRAIASEKPEKRGKKALKKNAAGKKKKKK